MLFWKKYALGLGLFALFAAIFFSVFALYGLPLGAVIYPALLFAVLGGGLALLDIRREKQRRARMRRLLQLPAALMRDFPVPRSAAEEDDLRLIQALRQEAAQAREEAQAREREAADYYTAWVHQVKTPLAALRLLLQGEDSDLSRRAGEEALRIEQYVEMVLAFQRLDSASTDYAFARCDLDAVVRQALRRFSALFIRKGIGLSYAPLRARALTDEKWLLFVLEQVLMNALKYTPAGGTITIALEAPLALLVRDTGVGIAPEDLPRVFERGFTGYNGRADKRATGLGLYLCRRILRALGHDIALQSAPGEGTSVRIDLSRQEERLE